MTSSPAVLETELEQFNALAAQWWDSAGPMAPLHRMNPTRLEFIVRALTAQFGAVAGLRLLDVGCGGGIVSEPMARLGAQVVGIDGAAELIGVAQRRAAEEGLPIDYRPVLTGELVAAGDQFDAVLALEVIEHVPDPGQFIGDLAALTRPGGLVILSTLNRNLRSLAFGIGMAEYVLRWLPPGTHDWRRFVKPSELFGLCADRGLTPLETMGVVYRPASQSFALDPDNVKINYFLTARKT